jgi:hypothetical protein
VSVYKQMPRIAARILQNTHCFPDALREKIGQVVQTCGESGLLADFEAWCGEVKAKNQYIKHPLFAYAKVVDSRLGQTPSATITQPSARELKSRAGFIPFARRLKLANGYSACPFHDGDGDKSFHIVQTKSGAYIGTCFSACGKRWNAVDFVMDFDKISIGEAIRKIENEIASNDVVQMVHAKKPAAPMTVELWNAQGRAVTCEDVARLAASRPDSATPSAGTLNALGFKMSTVLPDFLCCPFRLGDTFYTVKARKTTTKRFLQEHAVSGCGLFNIDAVTVGCDVCVVESELDVAVLHEDGHIAVSVMFSGQRMIEPEVMKKLLMAGRIFLIGDNDTAGIQCMDAIAKLLPPEKTYRMPLVGAKDVGVLYRQGKSIGGFKS